MYNQYYAFKEPPFNMTPSSRFFYSSPKHLEALNTMAYAISDRKGFVVISGEIGSGKTTVCRALVNQLDAKTQIALITNTMISGRDLICSILEDLEIDFRPGSKTKLLSQLNNFLIQQIKEGNNVVLIVDEAQNLTPSVLEEVRLLSNLETEDEKLIQIILLGQPELKRKLALPKLEQLRQRIAVYYHLYPLTVTETKEYVFHRLKVACGSDRKYFNNEALEMVYQFSKGVPRLINQICDSALLSGYVKEVKTIDDDIMREVIEEAPMTQITMESKVRSRSEHAVVDEFSSIVKELKEK